MPKKIDLTGQRFGRLVVTGEAPPKYTSGGNKIICWYCDCDCGTINKIVNSGCLIRNHTKSCGCLKKHDLTGKRFGRIVITEPAPSKRNKSGSLVSRWYGDCDCGNKHILFLQQTLEKGTCQSCGCLAKELASARLKSRNNYVIKDNYVIGYTSKNQEFYIDLDDINKVFDDKGTWYISHEGYVVRKNSDTKKTQYLQNLIYPDADQVDHIKHNKLDNRKSQLRPCNNSQNCQNKQTLPTNKSGHAGIFYRKKYNNFQASITAGGKSIYLGVYNTYEEALKVRLDAEDKYFGEFSYNNSQKK